MQSISTMERVLRTIDERCRDDANMKEFIRGLLRLELARVGQYVGPYKQLIQKWSGEK